MNDKIKKKKILVISIVSLVIISMIGIIYGVGRSFGFFTYIRESEIVNIVTIGDLKNGINVNILGDDENLNALNLQDIYPMYDSEGLSSTRTPFEFELTNNLKKNILLSITVENDSEKQSACTIEKKVDNKMVTLPCSELSTEYIRFAYKIDDGEYSTPETLSRVSNIIVDGYQLDSKDTVKISILLWIDKDAGNEIQGHTFFGKLILQEASYQTYTVGDAITLVDGSKWHVLENSDAASSKVTLLSDYNLNADGTYNTTCQGVSGDEDSYKCSLMMFDVDINNVYEGSDVENFINNTYKPLVSNSLSGITNVTIPTAEQIVSADGKVFPTDKSDITITNLDFATTTNYWTRTPYTDNRTVILIYGFDSSTGRDYCNSMNLAGVRPVITTPKYNILNTSTSD